MVVEPLHADPMLHGKPYQGRSHMVTDETDDSPEDTTLTGGVVVIAVTET